MFRPVVEALERRSLLSVDPFGILAAYKAGLPSVTIPAGVYRLDPQPSYDINLYNMSNFRIVADGVTIVNTDPTRGEIVLGGDRNITIDGGVNGLTLRHETPTFTQGVIVAEGPGTFDVQIDAGYPALAGAHPIGFFYDGTTRTPKIGAADCYFSTVTQAGSLYHLTYSVTGSRSMAPVLVGDLVAFREPNPPKDVSIGNCSGITLKGVRVENGGYAFYENAGDGGNVYSGISVGYAAPPAGATSSPLLSSCADSFHSSEMRVGPTITGSTFVGGGDDAIAIHGFFATVTAVSGSDVTVTYTGNATFALINDPIRLYGVIGDSYVTAVTKLSNTSYKVTLGSTLAVQVGSLLSNPNVCGRGYVLSGNTILNNRARGMLLKADDGLVSGNSISGSTIAGIVVAPELKWNEGGYAVNVRIENNVIRNTGYSTYGGSDWQRSGIAITGESGVGNDLITLLNNDLGGLALIIDHTARVVTG